MLLLLVWHSCFLLRAERKSESTDNRHNTTHQGDTQYKDNSASFFCQRRRKYHVLRHWYNISPLCRIFIYGDSLYCKCCPVASLLRILLDHIRLTSLGECCTVDVMVHHGDAPSCVTLGSRDTRRAPFISKQW